MTYTNVNKILEEDENLIKEYKVDEDYYWDFVNTKVKKIIFDIE